MPRVNHRRPRAQAAASRPNGHEFDWPVANEAERVLRRCIDEILDRNGRARLLAQRVAAETGTDVFEWVDHLVLPWVRAAALLEAGFTEATDVEAPSNTTVLEHPRTALPRVLLRKPPRSQELGLALHPESIADFIARQNLSGQPAGDPYSRYRCLRFATENGTWLEAVERRAYRGFVTAPLGAAELRAIVRAKELWRCRRRHFVDANEGFREGNATLAQVLAMVGRDLACQFFFNEERAYWESRNRAARIQKHRQDRLGLGWGNHDHHTFRCSREHFVDLIQFLERLGFHKRERFYAGAEAGWGAQVLEQPVAGIVVFADVDLLPGEIEVDFSARRLPPTKRLGTVGLWVALHGESFLEAGMHHLEARFDFARLRHQLEREGIKSMQPFSDFPFLKQAFTEGERWSVNPKRLGGLLQAGLITRVQHDEFLEHGALGSHLENLQRHGGFKGFNQKSVSAVIPATDPRKQHLGAEPQPA